MPKPRLQCLRPRLDPAPAQGWAPDAQRGNTTQRGYGWAWVKQRDRILKRDCGLCQPCLRLTPALVHLGNEVDHIIGKASGGTDDDSNLQAINAECHRIKTARESQTG